MFLSHMNLARRSLVAGIAFLAFFVLAGVASAQSPRLPRIPPDARGFQTALKLREFTRQQAAARTTPPPSKSVAPSVSPPRTIAVRSPDGTVRIFEVDPNVEIRRQPR